MTRIRLPAVAKSLIRPIPDTFDQALVRHGRPRIDVGLARAQHDTYRQQLEAAGYAIEQVPTDPEYPDCVFIEDTAVIIGSTAVITRPGAASRRGETGPVAVALREHFPLVEVETPGTIDGGDVFIMRDVVYVGRSGRTNQEGIDQLKSVATDQGLDLVAVGVHDALHLKSVVLPVDDETLVVTPNAVDETALVGFRLVFEANSERHRFSALPLRDGRLLVTSGAPETAAALEATGHDVVPIDVSQIQMADGGLTCMSILF
jgi:dimethylargininase